MSLSQQSDIDAISGRTTIYGNLNIFLNGPSGITPIPPVTFNLPEGLQTVTGSVLLDTFGNAPTTALNAPGIVTIGSSQSNTGDLSLNAGIVDYTFESELMSTSFPLLKSIGGSFAYYTISNLSSVNGFAALERVGQDIDIEGNFISLALPALNFVGANINILSTNMAFRCPKINVQVAAANQSNLFYCQYEYGSPPSETSYHTTMGVKSSATISESTPASPTAHHSGSTGIKMSGNIYIS